MLRIENVSTCPNSPDPGNPAADQFFLLSFFLLLHQGQETARLEDDECKDATKLAAFVGY